MTPVLSRGWFIVGVACLAAAGCVVPDGGGGYGYGYGGGLPADYYQPSGFSYGGWGPGYDVGPYRGGGRYVGGYAGHAYHPAAGGRGMPGLPPGGHGGGGGHAGGGGGHAGGGGGPAGGGGHH